MSKVELFEDIRRARRDEGISIRDASKRFRVHRRDVRRAVNGQEPVPRAVASSRPAPVSGPWREWMRQVLIDDQDAPRKQRHSAKRIGERLAQEHGVVICPSRVRAVVAQLRAELAQPDTSTVIIAQTHAPGAEAEVDWGVFTGVIGGTLMPLQLFVMRASFSSKAFHRAYAHAAQESFLDAHVRGFAHLGGVPKMVRYDNLKTAVTQILKGRGRVENDRFTALRSHYLFDSFFCRPGIAGAHEKGGVEGEIGRFRRNHLTPVPVFDTLADLNTYIEACQEKDDERFITGAGGGGATVKELAVIDQAGMWSLPMDSFTTTTRGSARVDAKARVCIRQCFYSVPAHLVGARLAFELGAETLSIRDGAMVVARHARALHRKTQILDIDHYLEVLWTKPGALLGSTALVQARASGRFTPTHQLFWDLARRQHGDKLGTRALCEVLLLHRYHCPSQIIIGLQAALAIDCTDPAVVAVETRRSIEHPAGTDSARIDLPMRAPGAHRPLPALGVYDGLLTHRKEITR